MQKVCEDLQSAGVDLEIVIGRFMGNEEMYIKFLKRFMEDENFQNMQKHYKQGNVEEAFKASHTLKGLTANLGLDGIMVSVAVITEKLRAGIVEGIDELMEQAGKEYEMVVNILKAV
ncbi:MAG: Hpt domain-containing protein [Lachnospiraceae bacterium]|nr:Hpt domain-containing protein [Lachnospiraceae bacterium]